MSGQSRGDLMQMLGKLPPFDQQIGVVSSTREECPGYIKETLLLNLNGREHVPAYMLLPKGITGPVPAILYHHAHGGQYGIGKQELLSGCASLLDPPFGEVLPRMGYAVLCLDTWGFGERSTKSETYLFKQMLWQGSTLLGMMLYDSLRAIDYLHTRPEVDASRIGVMGMSMGSTMSWWLAALEPRIKMIVDSCCLTDFHTLLEVEQLDLHGVYYYVPNLLNRFTTADINALIAPRPHLSLVGIHDPLTPMKGVDKIDEELKRVYRQAGAPDAWQLRRYDTGHMETPQMRLDTLDFLQKWL